MDFTGFALEINGSLCNIIIIFLVAIGMLLRLGGSYMIMTLMRLMKRGCCLHHEHYLRIQKDHGWKMADHISRKKSASIRDWVQV